MQKRPWPLAILSLAVMLAFLVPFFGMRLDTSDAGNDPTNTSTYKAFNLLVRRIRPGLQRSADDRRADVDPDRAGAAPRASALRSCARRAWVAVTNPADLAVGPRWR